MARNLPDCVFGFVEELPESRKNEIVERNIKEFGDLYGEKYVESVVWSQEDARRILSEMGVHENTLIFEFYLYSFELPDVFRTEALYGLSEIYADFKNSYWGEKHPEISEKYLQLSSIEGEYSYFYKKESGEVFGVALDKIDLLVAGEIEPLFYSFYEFLNWYFSDDTEK